MPAQAADLTGSRQRRATAATATTAATVAPTSRVVALDARPRVRVWGGRGVTSVHVPLNLRSTHTSSTAFPMCDALVMLVKSLQYLRVKHDSSVGIAHAASMVKVQLEQSPLSQLDFPKTPFLLQKTWYHPEVGSKLQLPSASRVISNAGSAWAHVPSSDSLYTHSLKQFASASVHASAVGWWAKRTTRSTRANCLVVERSEVTENIIYCGKRGAAVCRYRCVGGL